MLPDLLLADAPDAVPIHLVTAQTWPEVREGLPEAARAYLAATGFEGKPKALALVPGAAGLSAVVYGVDAQPKPGAEGLGAARLASLLPAGTYAFATPPDTPFLTTLAYLLDAYRFTRYRKAEAPAARLVVPPGVDRAAVVRQAEAVARGRDLINTPANDLGPVALMAAAEALADAFDANTTIRIGETLLAENFPMIHAVGRAAAEAPRLVDFTWGDPAHPKLTLVGKGVCFDTGGLNIKPDNSMLLMKKDMGGAAAALTAAAIIMGEALPVRLRVLLPIVENSISGPAFRPGDVLPSRAGLTVEIGNTDAEGRLILADALALADEEAPDLLVDFATLTGAARVALGAELPPFFTDHDALAAAILAASAAVIDPVWRLPLWSPYAAALESKVADLNNAPAGGLGGAITAALFLKRFVPKTRAYAHFDIFAWTPAAKPGRPEGGEPQAARLVAELARRLGREGAGAFTG